MDRVTLGNVYSMYKMYHLECKMQDNYNLDYTECIHRQLHMELHELFLALARLRGNQESSDSL